MRHGIRLNSTQRSLLSVVDRDPDLSAKEIAKRLRLKVQTVYYSLARMKESGLIGRRCFINSARLGYMDIAVFFSLTEQGLKERRNLNNRIIGHPRVVNFGSLLGDYQHYMVLLCRSLDEFNPLLTSILAGAGDVFSDKLVAPRAAVHSFARKYLAPKHASSKVLTIRADGAPREIDRIDHTILCRLGESSVDSLRSLARELDLPLATVDRRIKRLTSEGIITGFFTHMEESLLGVHCYRLLVMKKGLCSNARDRLFEFCREHTNIVYLIESLGAWDFEIGIETEDVDDVQRVVEELYRVCGMRIASIRVLTEVREHKCHHYPFHVGMPPTSSDEKPLPLAAGARAER